MSPWKSPLKGYENAEPLPTTLNSDGKSLYNPPGTKSPSYDEFPKPIDSSNNGFDFHSTSLAIQRRVNPSWDLKEMPRSMLIISVSTFSILFANRAIRGDLREGVARTCQEGVPRGTYEIFGLLTTKVLY